MPLINTWNYKDYLLSIMALEALVVGGLIIWAILTHGLLLFKKILYCFARWATCEENIQL